MMSAEIMNLFYCLQLLNFILNLQPINFFY